MKTVIELNGVIYTPLAFSINRELPELGELRPNRASITLDNTQDDFKFNPTTNKIIDKNNNVVDKDIKIIIYDYETSKIFFTGYTDIPEINIKNKTLKINAHDSITYLQDQIAEEKLYLDFQIDDILLDILNGYDISNEFENINLVIDNYRIEKDTTKADAIKVLLNDIGALLYTNERNEFVFDGGYIKALQNPPKISIDDIHKTHTKSYDTTLPDNSYDKIIIKSESLKKKDKLKYVYINADYEKPEADITKANFDNPIWFLDSYANVEFKSDDGVTFDETTYNSNFLVGNTPKNADSIEVKYGSSTGVIDYLKIKGKEFEINNYEGIAGADLLTNKTKTIKCSLIQSSTWASDLANYYYRQLYNRPQSRVILADFERFFDLEYNLNKYVNVFFIDEGISNKMQIIGYKINVNTRKFDVELNLRYNSGDSFVPSPITITESTNTQGLDLDEIESQVFENTNNISDILSDLSDISNDNKLTADEKKQIQKLYNTIVDEKTIVENKADYYSISKTNYLNAYNTLINYLDTLNIFTLTTVSINRNTFNNNFTNYYTEKTKIYEELSNISNSRIGLTEQELNDIANDSKLTPNEKKIVKKEWERIQAEYNTTVLTADAYYIDPINYQDAYNSLDSYITPLLSSLTTTDNINRSTFNNKFNAYYAALKNITDNTDIKVNQDLTNKKISQGTIFELGKGALPDGSDGLYIDNGQLLIGQSKTADKRLYYDGTNLEIVGGTLKLSQEAGNTIEFLDSGIKLYDDKDGQGDPSIMWEYLNDSAVSYCQDLTTYVNDGLYKNILLYEDSTYNITFSQFTTTYRTKIAQNNIYSEASSIYMTCGNDPLTKKKITLELHTMSKNLELVLTEDGLVLPKIATATAGSDVPSGTIWYNPNNGRVYIKRNGVVDRFIMASEF